MKNGYVSRDINWRYCIELDNEMERENEIRNGGGGEEFCQCALIGIVP